MQEKLVKGDIVTLKTGMRVYTKMPAKFIYSNQPLSKELSKADIAIDKIYHETGNLSAAKTALIKSIIEDFASNLGYQIHPEKVMEFVDTIVADTQELVGFVVESGDFVVIDTKFDGGGTAMFRDHYPDGHHVFCKRLKDGKYDPEGQEVDFYQSNGFTACIMPGEITAKGILVQKFE